MLGKDSIQDAKMFVALKNHITILEMRSVTERNNIQSRGSEMRKASLLVLVSIFIFSGRVLAQETQGPDWISGEVISLGFEGEDGLMGVKLADGEVYNVSVTKNQISDIHIGDYVTINIVKGWAQTVTKKQSESNCIVSSSNLL